MGDGGMKILVVDDEVQICKLINAFLTRQGFQVVTATNGKDAISKFSANRPDMIFLDIKLPALSGMDVLREIKKIDKKVVVIILSAFGDMETVDTALELGANGYLQKPVELNRLMEIINSYKKSGENAGPR
ncbi:MAG: response regulator [Desulfobacterales bacterium]|nr:response regulator [Desulfobacterales bacterium]